ncbi:Yip1-domain-containing protein [Hysterangium stoloniferum]|nr:Yip1-domain-containing protein [Hysterangium stoloniferum]
MFSNQYNAAAGSPYAQAYPPPTNPNPNPNPNTAASGTQPLQFYSAGPSHADFPGGRPSLDGHVTTGAMGGSTSFGGSIQPSGGWWSAFGTGGIEGEPPLLEELGINFSHIRAKSMTVLNPLRRIDEHIMDDADMAGPVLFYFAFATFLLISGSPQFGSIYGVALLGTASLYTLLNLMSESPIDAYRVASVLGYCLLPMVGVGAGSIVIALDGVIGYFLSVLSVIWCTYAASGIFVTVLRMSDQRLLVAYPVGLLYGCFGLLSVFRGGK